MYHATANDRDVHAKIWLVDASVCYTGCTNCCVRSMRADHEQMVRLRGPEEIASADACCRRDVHPQCDEWVPPGILLSAARGAAGGLLGALVDRVDLLDNYVV